PRARPPRPTRRSPDLAIPAILVGTHTDAAARAIPVGSVAAFAKAHSMHAVEVSSVTGEEIPTLLRTLADHVRPHAKAVASRPHTDRKSTRLNSSHVQS